MRGLPVKTGFTRARGVQKTLKSVRDEAGSKVTVTMYSEPRIEADLVAMLEPQDGTNDNSDAGVFLCASRIADNEKRASSIKDSDLVIVIITSKMTNDQIARSALFTKDASKRLVVILERILDDLRAAKLSSVFGIRPDDVVFMPEFEIATVQSALMPRILSSIGGKEIALAVAVPSFRDEVVRRVIAKTSYENAAIGFLVFIPGADMPLLTMNQIRMVLRLCAIYGRELSLKRLYEMLSVVAGGFVFRELSRELVAFVPVLGWPVKGAIAYAGTIAMGRLTVKYLESGSSDEVKAQ